eukprot:6491965-Amphidinium_carterae.1
MRRQCTIPQHVMHGQVGERERYWSCQHRVATAAPNGSAKAVLHVVYLICVPLLKDVDPDTDRTGSVNSSGSETSEQTQ